MRQGVAFVGDIHGVLDPVLEVAPRALREAETLVFLGDYVNRGPDSRAVIDYLIDLQSEFGNRVRFLAGHHDAVLRQSIRDGRSDRFLRLGGAATLRNYPRLAADGSVLPLEDRLPSSHVAFLESLEEAYVSTDCIGAHFDGHAPARSKNQFGVFGHRLQTSRTPFIADDFALIDTGCGTIPDGRLTCLLWPSLAWFQSS